MAFYKTEAVTLRSVRFGEADKLVTFFARTHGKVSAIAKSALKTSSKFGARLEPFSYNQIFLAKGKNLDILSQIETIETFHTIREEEHTFQAAMYIIKVVTSFLEDGVKNEALFDLVTDSFFMLKSGVLPLLVTRMFDVKFADLEGILPLQEFSMNERQCVGQMKNGDFDASHFSASDLIHIDKILIPCLSDHLGKDIRLWKSL
ncbi:MAG: DNA repair protein RecO [Candidatus Saganbacteria bacterium]|nr:DNA repair protein RecO [Candidatus Saganbacteria bacterium]